MLAVVLCAMFLFGCSGEDRDGLKYRALYVIHHTSDNKTIFFRDINDSAKNVSIPQWCLETKPSQEEVSYVFLSKDFDQCFWLKYVSTGASAVKEEGARK